MAILFFQKFKHTGGLISISPPIKLDRDSTVVTANPGDYVYLELHEYQKSDGFWLNYKRKSLKKFSRPSIQMFSHNIKRTITERDIHQLYG